LSNRLRGRKFRLNPKAQPIALGTRGHGIATGGVISRRDLWTRQCRFPTGGVISRRDLWTRQCRVPTGGVISRRDLWTRQCRVPTGGVISRRDTAMLCPESPNIAIAPFLGKKSR
jgi:hypothetical protein